MSQNKKPQNLLQFKKEDFASIPLQLCTKPKSLTFGRCLYTFEYQQQRYWLKTQNSNLYPDIAAGFVQEINFYRQFLDQVQAASFLLPFQIISHFKNATEIQGQGTTALLLAHADTWLGDLDDCTLHSVQHIKRKILLLLDAVEELHQLGWVHGDLKREHFVEYQKRACLIDFEQVQKTNSAQQQKNLTATPRYMAPELFHGADKTVQTDIYALGIILYEWLSGRRLTAKNYQDWAYLHCQRLSIELPQHLRIFEKLLMGMLAKQKQQRFADIYAIKQLLITENA